MERKAHRSGRFLVRLLVLSLAGFAAAALHRERKAVIEPELDAPKRRERELLDSTAETHVALARRRVSTPRRLAVGLALTAIFFAGAAFTAGAGNEVAGLLEDAASTDTTLTSSSAPDPSAGGRGPGDPPAPPPPPPPPAPGPPPPPPPPPPPRFHPHSQLVGATPNGVPRASRCVPRSRTSSTAPRPPAAPASCSGRSRGRTAGLA
jgi:hypothetical protein